MIKLLKFDFIRPRYLLTLTLFLLGILIIFFNIGNYQKQANQEILLPEASKKEGKNLILREIKARFSSPVNLDSNYDVIAKNNLFSPERKAWQPPKPDDPEQEKQKNVRRRHINHKNIRLYGSTIFSNQKMALMYFQPFSDKQKYRMVQEGQTIRDSGDRGEDVFFHIKTIKEQKVVLEDPHGESFEVGLYDHQRSRTSPPSQQARSRIIIGGQNNNLVKEEARDSQGSIGKTKPQTRSSNQTSKENYKQTSKETSMQDQKSDQEQEKSQKKEQRTNPFKALLQKMRGGKEPGSGSDTSKEEQEKKVEQGKTRKIETPFGTIYRPAK